MGYRLAEAARDRGATVILVSGPTSLPAPHGVELVSVRSAEDMQRAVADRVGPATVVIAAAAVSDYRPAAASASKIKKTDGPVTLELVRTPDILKGLGEAKGGRLLVGFAAETEDLVGNARKKLEAKNLDLVVANDVTAPRGRVRRGHERGRPAAARRGPGGRAARLEAGGGGAHPRRGGGLARRRGPAAVSERDEHAGRPAGPRPLPLGRSARSEWPRRRPPSSRRRVAAVTGSRRHGRQPTSARTTRPSALAAIREEIGDCRRCKLASGRKTIVFGQGNPRAELMFVGEAPGADEDEQGLAFVGRAGQLLTDIIEKGMKMKRSDVFIGNVLKCRPPQNRNPEPDEILACQPFLEAQIRAIRPRVLVGLGKFAAHWLLRTAEPISRLRGRLGEHDGIPVMPTYHPAYLLRNPAAKKDVWEDMKTVLGLLGRPVPAMPGE